MMNTYLATGIPAEAGVTHSVTAVAASTITVHSGNSIRVHAIPHHATKVIGSIGTSPSPNVNISSKRIRISSKDKDAKKLAGLSSAETSTSSGLLRKEISLEADLRNMMHAFGDTCNPLDESIKLMESILKQELQGFVCVCDSIAAISGSKTLGLQEPINAIRNERSRLVRLLKYFAIKDQQQRLQRMNQISQQGIVPASKTYLEEIRTILDKLDESGEFTRLLDSDYIIETTKSERALRADKIFQRISYSKFQTYSKARSVSFARKIGNLQNWVSMNTRSDFKMGSNFMEVLSFLAYEIVSQMVDLAFIVRREHIPSTNPIYRLSDTRVLNPETCMSSPAFQKRKDDPCNSVSEILVQASEIEAKRLKKVTTNNKEIQLAKNMFALTPSEIGEAYSRFQRCILPAISYKVRAEKLRRLNNQY